MNFAACLKPEFNGGLELEGEQQAYVFQNSIIITFMQMSLILLIWIAYYDSQFKINRS